MPKKASVNGYGLFVEEMKGGTHFQGNPYEYFGPMWKALPAHERQSYNSRAKEKKVQMKSDLECKFTTTGQSYAEVDRIQREKSQKMEEMYTTIEKTITALEIEKNLALQPFFLMHVNYFCVSDEGMYFPAEVGLVRFSLANGIEEFYHKIVDPGPFPTGSFRNAMEYSRETHNLPCPPNPSISERNFDKIDREIKEFLLGKEGFQEAREKYQETKKPITLPPIYTYYNKEMLHYNKDNDVVVRSFLENLPEYRQPSYVIRVYELTKLLYELRNACVRQAGLQHSQDGGVECTMRSPMSAQAELERDLFSHSAGLACAFHEEGDFSQHCSLSWARRWGFVLADNCCSYLGIMPVPGLHCPVKGARYHTIELPATHQEVAWNRKVQPTPNPVPVVTAAEVVKKRAPFMEPLKELRQPQASCIDTLASQFSDKLKTSSKPAGSVTSAGCEVAGAGRGVAGAMPVVGAGRGVAGAVPVVGVGRGAATATKMGAGVSGMESVAVAGRGHRLLSNCGNPTTK